MVNKWDLNVYGGGVVVYLGNNIAANLLKLENLPLDIEASFIKMNIKGKNMVTLLYM